MYEYCKNCGDRIDPNAAVCPSCGAVTGKGRAAVWGKVFPWILGIFAFAVVAALVWAVVSSPISPKSYLDRIKKTQMQAEFVITENEEPMVLWEENGVTILLTRVGKSSVGRTVNLRVKNSTTKDLVLSGRNFVVNGITVAGSLYTKVPAEWEVGALLEFDEENLEDADITEIATLRPIDTRISNARTNELLADVSFEIRTDIADTYVQEIDEGGQLLYSENGVTIICKLVRDCPIGKEVLFLVKNETDHELTLREKNFKINGCDIGGGNYEVTEADSVTFGRKTFLKSELEELGIDDIKDVTFDIEYWNPKDYQNVTYANGLQAVFKGYEE